MNGWVVIEWTARGGPGCRLTIHPTPEAAQREVTCAKERAKGWGFRYTVAHLEGEDAA